MAGRRGKVQTPEQPGSAVQDETQSEAQRQTQLGGKGFYISRKMLVALALAGVLVVAAVLFLGGVVTGQNTASAPPTAAERAAEQRAQQQEQAVEAAKGANFSAGTVKKPVDGATDGLEVIGSFVLYVAQGKTDKAMQYVVNPSEPSVQEAIRRIQDPEAAEARRRLLENGADLSSPDDKRTLAEGFSPVSSINALGGGRFSLKRSGRPVSGSEVSAGRMYAVFFSVAHLAGMNYSPWLSLSPVFLPTNEGVWKIAGFNT